MTEDDSTGGRFALSPLFGSASPPPIAAGRTVVRRTGYFQKVSGMEAPSLACPTASNSPDTSSISLRPSPMTDRSMGTCL